MFFGVFLEGVASVLKILLHIIFSWIKWLLPKQRKSVKGQIVLITGAGSGIGRLIAFEFAKRGATLVLWDVNEQGNAETADEIRANIEEEAEVHTYSCDISKRHLVYKTADKVKKDIGDVDILVNNAGIVSGKKLLDTPDELIVKTMEVNALAHFWTVKAFLPSMLERNQGHIVTMASVAGIFGISGMVDYASSKFAARGFHDALRMELVGLGKDEIKMTLVCPYLINTGMFDGITVRLPSLLSGMEPSYVVDRLVDAVLTNQEVLILPRQMYLHALLKVLYPTPAWIEHNRFAGSFTAMDNFVGRNKTD